MKDTVVNNKKIARNTIVLYIRMLFLMLIALYTSRVTLDALGETDFGLYSVIGGIVIILSCLTNSMSGAAQRFMNYSMGKDDIVEIQKIFSSAIQNHKYVAFFLFILAETIGLWFLNTKMNIPIDRIIAANWVYQFSIATFMVSIISIPYNAAIIAHEKMSIFAYISIIEAILKLIVAFLIQMSSFDRLKEYSVLLFCIGICSMLLYQYYCRKNFQECHFKKELIDKKISLKMLSFSSWTILGDVVYIMHTQGIAICINIFFGAIVNAANGIANTVNSAVTGFSSSFQVALKPQLVLTYAKKQMKEMHRIIFRGCRYSFFLIILLAIPLIAETPYIISIWLKEVPNYTIYFVRLVLLVSIVNSYSSILATAQGATGSIKNYQICVSIVGGLHVPIALLLFYYGLPPYSCFWVYLIVAFFMQIVRLIFVSKSVNMPIVSFFRIVILPCIIVLVLSSITPYLLHLSCGEGILMLFFRIILTMLMTILVIYLFGLEKSEKLSIYLKTKHLINNF